MKSKTLPKPECESGYPDKQLKEILKDEYRTFLNFMTGQTMCLCDGREYDYELEEYRYSGCGPHGAVAYPWNLKGFLDGRKVWD